MKYLFLIIFSTVFFFANAQNLETELRIYNENLSFIRRLERAFTTTEGDVFANGIFVPKTKIGKSGMDVILTDLSELTKVLSQGENAFDEEHLTDLLEINQKMEVLKVTVVSRAIFILLLDSRAQELNFMQFKQKRALKKVAKLVPETSAEDLRELWGDSANELDSTILEVIEALKTY